MSRQRPFGFTPSVLQSARCRYVTAEAARVATCVATRWKFRCSRCAARKKREFLVTRTDAVNVHAGLTLIMQGSPGDIFCLRLDGEAAVQVDRRDRPPLHTRSFFGEVSMLDRGRQRPPLLPRLRRVDGDESRTVPRCDQGQRPDPVAGDKRDSRVPARLAGPQPGLTPVRRPIPAVSW